MMRLSCAAGRHDAGSRRIRNQGFEFACCRGCGHDLVRSRGAWRAVPKGFRVVWRRAGEARAEISAAQLLFDLPCPGRDLALAAAPKRARRRLAAALELAAMGARCFAWALADRLRLWVRSLAAPRPAARPVLSLTAG